MNHGSAPEVRNCTDRTITSVVDVAARLTLPVPVFGTAEQIHLRSGECRNEFKETPVLLADAPHETQGSLRASVLSQKFAAQECRSSPPCFVALLAWCPTKLRAASRLTAPSAFLHRVAQTRVGALSTNL